MAEHRRAPRPARAPHIYRGGVSPWAVGRALPPDLARELSWWRRFTLMALIVLVLAGLLWVAVQ